MFVLTAGRVGATLVEHFSRHLLWYMAIFGSFTSTIFLGMALVAALYYVAKARRARQQTLLVLSESLPPVTVLKPVHGLEPRLEETLESFFRQDYPNYEIIFGARREDDASLAVVAKLRVRKMI